MLLGTSTNALTTSTQGQKHHAKKHEAVVSSSLFEINLEGDAKDTE